MSLFLSLIVPSSFPAGFPVRTHEIRVSLGTSLAFYWAHKVISCGKQTIRDAKYPENYPVRGKSVDLQRESAKTQRGLSVRYGVVASEAAHVVDRMFNDNESLDFCAAVPGLDEDAL